MREVSASGMTAIFELTAPEARIVVLYPKPALTLLHVRDNVTGQYVMTDHGHEIHSMIRKYNIPVVRRYEGMSVGGAIQSLEQMNEMEGYVIQFKSGLMAKLKCPWYLRLHRCVTFLRERDIAKLAIAEELDDVKAMLVESGVDLTPVEGVESRVKNILTEYLNEIEKIYSEDRYLERKDFALKHKGNEVFGLLMARYLGKEVPLVEWYSKNKLSQDFSLNVLADGVRSEELDMQTPKEKMRA